MVEQRNLKAERSLPARLDKSAERDKLDALLDEALKETFPASDSVAVTPPRKRRFPGEPPKVHMPVRS